MKVLISFFVGVTVSGLLLLGIVSALPILAQSEDLGAASGNLSQSLVELLPDIEKIYREALTSPLHEAGKTIYDEDIARFYHTLLDNMSLDEPSN